ncbi:LacI family DNA-binding transcriptional regulator [Jatrophihabitans sp. YIM 134969]
MSASGRVTIADVAARAGVSAGAVSFALNGRPGVAASTRERILAVAEELGWTPNVRARSLSRSTSYTVGLVLARPTATVGADPFFPAFVAGVNAVLTPVGRSLLFTVVPDADTELATYRRLAGESRVDGVFLTDLRFGDPRPALLSELGLPAVTVGRPEPAAPGVGSVSVDDVPGVRETVEELVALGHRRIAHVTGPAGYLHVRHRSTAWADALHDAGLEADLLVHTDFSAGEGARATADLLDLAERRRPTAITFANDVMALAGLAVATRHGLRVPDDLSVTGFDDTDLARHVEPPLASVNTDVEGWGRACARALLAAVDGAAAEHLELAPARMVARASLGLAPQATTRRRGQR